MFRTIVYRLTFHDDIPGIPFRPGNLASTSTSLTVPSKEIMATSPIKSNHHPKLNRLQNKVRYSVTTDQYSYGLF